ncbi:hypothetical protein WJX79_008839 [Trebouxia sp. C0005]
MFSAINVCSLLIERSSSLDRSHLSSDSVNIRGSDNLSSCVLLLPMWTAPVSAYGSAIFGVAFLYSCLAVVLD